MYDEGINKSVVVRVSQRLIGMFSSKSSSLNPFFCFGFFSYYSDWSLFDSESEYVSSDYLDSMKLLFSGLFDPETFTSELDDLS